MAEDTSDMEKELLREAEQHQSDEDLSYERTIYGVVIQNE